MSLPVWPPFSIYRGCKHLDNSSVCVPRWSLEGRTSKATVTQSSFWAKALQMLPAPCLAHQPRGSRPLSAGQCQHSSASLQSSNPCNQSENLLAQPLWHCNDKQHPSTHAAPCQCTPIPLLGADVSRAPHAASGEPCTPEASSKSSTRPSQHASPLCRRFQPNRWNSELVSFKLTVFPYFIYLFASDSCFKQCNGSSRSYLFIKQPDWQRLMK